MTTERLPPELQLQVGEYLDPLTLSNAVEAGLRVNKPLFDRARHAGIWSSIISADDFSYLRHILEDGGNVFLVGFDLVHLFQNYPQQSAERPHLNLLIGCLSGPRKIVMDASKLLRDTKSQIGVLPIMELQGKNITLHVLEEDQEEYCLYNLDMFVNRPDLCTKVLYFRDEESGLRDMELDYVWHHRSAPSRFHYRLVLPPSLFGRDYQGRFAIDFQQEAALARNEPRGFPWHESTRKVRRIPKWSAKR
ncbi:hypothetical protein B0T10DRAFT_587999 [Thelonectria olida]|uniref:Uncharacterized protein n=1 Tax=Thelonectria olida TaxID=1576542 RepID=A0A9P9AJ94_9HYPO|nr:hypothetical protein B0T10DRAFT_587999 [Thelonectria olida]